MDELISLAQKLGGIGFPTLLVLILIGSNRQVWFWASVVLELRARMEAQKLDYEARLLSVELARQRWETMALRATGLAETAGQVIAKTINGH